MKTINQKLLEELLEDLRSAIKLGLFYLPDSYYYDKEDGRNYPWEACDGEEEEAVKQTRDIMNKALEKCKKVIGGLNDPTTD